ncbi:hypothetical protein TrRE_jg3741 [Triparma retinervis]|uniref:Uncharacterized protein n=1 Tax=Triparma retinervis TaxID=2557542 RepID=A0A9W7EA11_9STRA|nr:hypothetical protein TrRE_jg3741 [Triparma retinervis]
MAPPPSLTLTIRHYLGRCFRETGQMLDRVGLRGQAAAGKWRENKATMIMNRGIEDKHIDPMNHLSHKEPWLFEGNFSRHRTLMPIFQAGSPKVEVEGGQDLKMDSTPGTGEPLIAPCATVVGDVKIGVGASVWYGAVIRGDGHIKKERQLLNQDEDEGWFEGVEIGEGTNVQDNAVVSSCGATGRGVKVGWGVTIGHSATLVGCEVGDNVLVGMGATVGRGAKVESGSFLAAGAVVGEGTVVKSGELWGGQPARKLKDLSDKQKKQLFYQAEEYVKLSQRHKHIMELGGNVGEKVEEGTGRMEEIEGGGGK